MAARLNLTADRRRHRCLVLAGLNSPTDTEMISNLEGPEWELRNEILKRNHDMHPHRAEIIDDLGEKWAKTGNWRMRKDIGTAAAKIEEAANVIANAEKFDPWQVAESMVELRDEFQDFLAHMAIATGEMEPPYEFNSENAESIHPESKP